MMVVRLKMGRIQFDKSLPIEVSDVWMGVLFIVVKFGQSMIILTIIKLNKWELEGKQA